jgi:ATP-binding cassette subfamily B protein RaxB
MKRRLGDIVSRFSGVDTIQRVLTTSFLSTTLDGITASAAFVMMLLYGSNLVFITLGALGVYVLLRIARYFPLYQATDQQAILGARQSTHFLETVRGIKAVKLFNRESTRRLGWMALTVDQTNATIRSQKMMFLFQAANNLLTNLEKILVLWAGAYMVINRHATAGMLIAYLMYKDQFSGRIMALIDKYYDLKILRVQLDRLSDILLSEPEEDSGPKRVVDLEEPTIRLERVHFRYGDGDPEVLRGINCEFRYGEHVAIVGPSGCGKTTLMHILAGVVRPRSGRLLIGGEEMQKIGIANCRHLFGTVSQDDCLFAGTLYQNICFFDESPDLAWAEECARCAAIHDDIQKMPMRYETEVGDMGSALSGGQKQRILLARALYKKPSVLILDEATSHLNVEIEHEINSCIKALGMTRIVIAHRPETIAAADRVIRLQEGQIVDDQVRDLEAKYRARDEEFLEEVLAVRA